MKWASLLALSLLLSIPAEGARQMETRAMTLRLFSTDTYSKVLTDRPPTNETGKGDVIVVGSTLRNAVAQLGRPKGAVVGESTMVFTIRSATQADVVVESTLPGGWLRAAGRTRLGARLTYSVTGGRGRFAGARGTGESRALAPQANRRLNVYRLQLP